MGAELDAFYYQSRILNPPTEWKFVTDELVAAAQRFIKEHRRPTANHLKLLTSQLPGTPPNYYSPRYKDASLHRLYDGIVTLRALLDRCVKPCGNPGMQRWLPGTGTRLDGSPSMFHHVPRAVWDELEIPWRIKDAYGTKRMGQDKRHAFRAMWIAGAYETAYRFLRKQPWGA